jgi:hypothetical protein
MPKTLNVEKGSRKTGAEKDIKRPGAAKGTKRPDAVKGPQGPEVLASRVLNDVKKQIVSQFPEMKGVRPSVVKRKVPADVSIVDMIGKIDGELGATLTKMKGAARKREIYCASFEKKMKTSSGSVLQKIVRVTFDREGHILKLVSSK